MDIRSRVVALTEESLYVSLGDGYVRPFEVDVWRQENVSRGCILYMRVDAIRHVR